MSACFVYTCVLAQTMSDLMKYCGMSPMSMSGDTESTATMQINCSV